MERPAGCGIHRSEAQKKGLSCAYQYEAKDMWMILEDKGLAHGAQGQHVM